MVEKRTVNVDMVSVYRTPERKDFLHIMAWGDTVEVDEVTENFIKIRTVEYVSLPNGGLSTEKVDGYICPPKSAKVDTSEITIPRKNNKVLKVNFVDLQQGDGAVVESPKGKVMLIDGGDNQLFARYLASRYRGTSLEKPQDIECILVTHGDADHFKGLCEILKSEELENANKRIFIQPKRFYHNGLVKQPESVPEKERLGKTVTIDGDEVITELYNSLLDADPDKMNAPFKEWQKCLETWNSRSEIEFKNLYYDENNGDEDPFDFLTEENVEVAVLGPLMTKNGTKQGLKFLHAPPKGPKVGHEATSLAQPKGSRLSASHTINGHSVVLRMSYGGFSFLFTGDLNDESSRTLGRLHQSGKINLRSDVLKVPHHGSADFSGAFIKQVSPVISVISSGDESSRKEYIHPRATLMGTLGKYSRVEEPIILCTELAAFFNMEGWAKPSDERKAAKRGEFFAFSRSAFGMVKIRTDGERLFVYTDSGKKDMKEAYAYELDDTGVPSPVPVKSA